MLGDVFIFTELKGYICSLHCYLLCLYTLDKEGSHRLREEGGKSSANCCFISHPSTLDVGPRTGISQLQSHHCLPTIQLTGAVLLPQVFNLDFLGSMATLFLSIQTRNSFVSLPLLTHLSCVFSCLILLILFESLSDLPHVHPFISTLQVQALAIS